MRSPVFALALALTTLDCSAPTAAQPDDLTGRWQSARDSLSPSGSYQTTLAFAAGGGVTIEVRMYGLYPDQQPNDLTAYYRTTGTYLTVADALTIHPERQVWWDRFYGADSPEHVETPHHDASVYPEAHYAVSGDRLTLHYLSYPADAPVPTTAVFVRAQ
jgi:hypothetical protein